LNLSTDLDKNSLTITDVGHLPIVKQYPKQINVVETVDVMVQSQMHVSPGLTVLAMVLDTGSGRSPLYRLQPLFEDRVNWMQIHGPIKFFFGGDPLLLKALTISASSRWFK